MRTPALVDGQQTLQFDLGHLTTVYPIPPKAGITHTWWAYRCTCGDDPGADGTATYSHREYGEHMAAWHRHRTEPWSNPQPAPHRRPT